MTGAIIGLLAGVALLVWVMRRAGTRRREISEIDYEELEAAEREVRDIDIDALSGEDQRGDDWGPGTGSPVSR